MIIWMMDCDDKHKNATVSILFVSGLDSSAYIGRLRRLVRCSQKSSLFRNASWVCTSLPSSTKSEVKRDTQQQVPTETNNETKQAIKSKPRTSTSIHAGHRIEHGIGVMLFHPPTLYFDS